MTKLVNIWMESDDDFFNRVEACGGWPMKNEFVSFFHSGVKERECQFGNKYIRTEWWTTVYSRDDYLWWKLSSKRKEAEELRIREKFAAQIRSMA